MADEERAAEATAPASSDHARCDRCTLVKTDVEHVVVEKGSGMLGAGDPVELERDLCRDCRAATEVVYKVRTSKRRKPAPVVRNANPAGAPVATESTKEGRIAGDAPQQRS